MSQSSLDYFSAPHSFNYDQPYSSVPRGTVSFAEVTPAKKITFFKSGDPQFSGVKMAINNRTFKSFDALLDDLSSKIPLPFGVRNITTPQGTHYINKLEQLEDGGCYLCSDKRHMKPTNIVSTGHKPFTWQGSHPLTGKQRTPRVSKHEEYSTSVPNAHQLHGIPKKIMIVKNGDTSIQHFIILNRRNARSLKIFIEEIAELMQCSVRKLYTLDGRKIDSIQALLHCPSTLVCAGPEPFRPLVSQNTQQSSEKLPNLGPSSRASFCLDLHASKSNSNFGLETKKSIIHPRPLSSHRSMRFSLSSEKSFPNTFNTSSRNSESATFMGNCPHGKHENFTQSLQNDDIEKSVHVNKDGSLSVQMKVRFRLLNDQTLQWSTEIKKSSLMNKTNCDKTYVGKEGSTNVKQQIKPEFNSEVEDSVYSCDVEDSYLAKLAEKEFEKEMYQRGCRQHAEYDIWRNPLLATYNEMHDLGNIKQLQSKCSHASLHKKVACERDSMDTACTSSTEEYREELMQHTSCCNENGETKVEYCTISRANSRVDTHTSSSNADSWHESRATTASYHISTLSRGCSLCSHENLRRRVEDQEALNHSSDTLNFAEKYKSSATPEEEGCSNYKCGRTSVTSLMLFNALEEGIDENKEDRPISNISGSSQQSAYSEKNRYEREDETQCVTSRCSSVSSKKFLNSEKFSHSRPISVTSSCPKRSNKASYSNNLENLEDDRMYTPVSSCFDCAQKDNDEVNEMKERAFSLASSGKRVTKELSRGEMSEHEKIQFSKSRGCKNIKIQSLDESNKSLVSSTSPSRTSKYSKRHQTQVEQNSNSAESAVSISLEGSKVNRKEMLHRPEIENSFSRNTSECSISSSEKESKELSVIKLQHICSSLSQTSPVRSKCTCHSVGDDHVQVMSNSKNCNAIVVSRKRQEQSDINERTSQPDLSCFQKLLDDAEHGNGSDTSDVPPSSAFSQSEVLKVPCHCLAKGQEPVRCTHSVESTSSKHRKYAKEAKPIITKEGSSKCRIIHHMMQKEKDNRTHNSDLETSVRMQVSPPCSFHFPSPPKGKPNNSNIRSVLLKCSSGSSSSTSVCDKRKMNDSLESSRPVSSGSKSNLSQKLTDINNIERPEQENSNNSKESTEEVLGNSAHKKKKKVKVFAVVPESTDMLLPSVLPNTSPEDVVNEWLNKIPLDAVSMKYDLGEEHQANCAESEIMTRECQAKQDIVVEPDIRTTKDNAEPTADHLTQGMSLLEPESLYVQHPEPKPCDADNPCSDLCVTALHLNEENSAFNGTQQYNFCNGNQNIIPATIQFPIQLMKALLHSKKGQKLDRVHSLPELSPSQCKKLSNSAEALFTCLANLQLLDENTNPTSNSNIKDMPKYKELLNTFQSFCLERMTNEEEGILNQQLFNNPVASFKEHMSTDDECTPMSSSGIDVSSGSGGSGQGSVAGILDGNMLPKNMKEVNIPKEMYCNTNSVTGSSCLGNGSQINDEEKQSVHPATASSTVDDSDKIVPFNSSDPSTPDIASRVQWSGSQNSQQEQDDSDMNTQMLNTNTEQASGSLALKYEEIKTDCDEGDEDADDKSILEENEDKQSRVDINMNNTENEGATYVCADYPSPCEAIPLANDYMQKDTKCDGKEVSISDTKYISSTQRQLSDPDPLWVLNLLKKIEKEFMAHYADVMKEFKFRWNLEDCDKINEMINDLNSEIGKRIQKSIEKEIRKINSRAGTKFPRPPKEQFKRESTIETEQRRRRLQNMHNKSAVDRSILHKNGQQTTNYESSSNEFDSVVTVEERLTKVNEDEYCPCETCIKSKKATKSLKNALPSNIPVMEEFDLQRILKMKVDQLTLLENDVNAEIQQDGGNSENELNHLDAVNQDGEEDAETRESSYEPTDFVTSNEEILDSEIGTQSQNEIIDGGETDSLSNQTEQKILDADCEVHDNLLVSEENEELKEDRDADEVADAEVGGTEKANDSSWQEKLNINEMDLEEHVIISNTHSENDEAQSNINEAISELAETSSELQDQTEVVNNEISNNESLQYAREEDTMTNSAVVETKNSNSSNEQDIEDELSDSSAKTVLDTDDAKDDDNDKMEDGSAPQKAVCPTTFSFKSCSVKSQVGSGGTDTAEENNDDHPINGISEASDSKFTTMYPDNTSEDEDKDSLCSSHEQDSKKANVSLESSPNEHENSNTNVNNAAEPSKSDLDQDDFDF
ncbi:retinitis pigmentosa 1-like 1 protein [Protopterus annectens]|uniref:retinitis pigmentosa 1-like 1 protein n=1 Tax=Protopterus annectens TaxID=7888 RepID=UPI001CFB2505|nr:retinitis pigmentosa 1-like 1 protein [Protopterus annectens]